MARALVLLEMTSSRCERETFFLLVSSCFGLSTYESFHFSWLIFSFGKKGKKLVEKRAALHDQIASTSRPISGRTQPKKINNDFMAPSTIINEAFSRATDRAIMWKMPLLEPVKLHVRFDRMIDSVPFLFVYTTRYFWEKKKSYRGYYHDYPKNNPRQPTNQKWKTKNKKNRSRVALISARHKSWFYGSIIDVELPSSAR